MCQPDIHVIALRADLRQSDFVPRSNHAFVEQKTNRQRFSLGKTQMMVGDCLPAQAGPTMMSWVAFAWAGRTLFQ
jgi:hypothetical protein